MYANYSPGLSRSLLYTAPISCSPILSPNLLDKNWLFSFSVLYVIVKTQIFYIHSTVSGASLHVFSHLQRLFQWWKERFMVCTCNVQCPKPFPCHDLGTGFNLVQLWAKFVLFQLKCSFFDESLGSHTTHSKLPLERYVRGINVLARKTVRDCNCWGYL